MVAGLVALVAVVAFPTSAPVPAAVLASSIAVAADGSGHGTGSQCQLQDTPGVPVDASDADGVVCTNDIVVYVWDFNMDADGADATTFVQTLPEGWTWDPISLVACQGNGVDFTGTPSLSPDGRTLTCVIDAPATGSSASFQIPVQARVGATVQNGSTYVASLSVTEAGTPQLSSAEPVVVRAAPRYDLNKAVLGGQGFVSNVDFGNGPEQAYYLDFRAFIDVPDSNNVKGLEPIQGPWSFTEAGFSTKVGVPLADARILSVTGLSSGTVTAPGSFPAPVPSTITVDGASTGAPSGLAGQPSAVWHATIRIAVPADQVPAAPVGLDVVNRYAGFEPVGIHGTPNFNGTRVEEGSEAGADCGLLLDPVPGGSVANNNCAAGHMNGTPQGTGPSGGKDIYLREPGGTPCSVNNNIADNCPRLPGETGSENGYALPGTKIWARAWNFAGTAQGGVVLPATDLVVCDTWDPALQTIDPTQPVKVGQYADLPGGDYVVQFSNRTHANDTDRQQTGCGSGDPADLTTDGPWFADIASAGGPSAVTAVRVTSTGSGGVWQSSGSFVIGVPMIAGSTTGPVPDFFGARWDERATMDNPNGYRYVARDGYRVTEQVIGVDKDTVPSGTIATATGAVVDFRLQPTVSIPGSPDPDPVTGYTVIDHLHPCMTNPVVDPQTTSDWNVTITPGNAGPDGIPCTGDTGEAGAIITAVAPGPVTPNDPLPPVDYAITVSPLVGNGASIANVVVVSADGNQQPEATRADIWILAVAAPGAVRVSKVADFPLVEIEPDDLSWTISWSNTLNSPDTAGATTFIDILPHDGDGRGTSFSGTFNLLSVTQLGSSADVTVSFTDADPTTIDPDPATNTSTWCVEADLGSPGCPAALADVTAIRIHDADFRRGEIGGLNIQADPAGNVGGDVYVNNVALGRAANLAQPIPATPNVPIEVVASTVGDRVWEDVNGDGVQDPDEPGIPDVELILYDDNDVERGRTTTVGDGLYSFTNLHSGTYRVVVNPATLPPNISHTYDLDGGTTSPDGDSGAFLLGVATDRDDVDFGIVAPEVEVRKEVTSGPTSNGDGTFTVTYDIEVENVGSIATTYDLGDVFAFGEGAVAVASTASIVNTSPGTIPTNPGWNGESDVQVVADAAIAVATTHVYTVTVDAAVAVDTTLAASDCTMDQGENGTGLRNVATADVGGVVVGADACAELPIVAVDKEVTAGPVPVGDGTYDVTYEVTVSNVGEVDTTYDLSDELTFGDGVTITTGSVEVANTVPGTIPTNSSFDGVDDLAVAAGVPIVAGEDHVYTVTVNASVAVDITQEAGDCTLRGSETGTGALNAATLIHNGLDQVARDCVPLGVVSVLKVMDGDPVPNSDGTWTASYDITVTNSGARDTTYDLGDELRFGLGVDVVSATVAAVDPPGIVTDPGWDGIGRTTVVADEPITQASSHRYRVTVVVTLGEAARGEASDCVVDDDEAGTGFLNVVTLVSDDLTQTREDCAPVSAVSAAKELVGDPEPNGDGTYTLRYEITVTNEGAGDGTYNLSDELAFGPGFTVVSAQATNVVPGTITVDGSWDGRTVTRLVADEVVVGYADHLYEVVVVARPPVDRSAETGDCEGSTGDTGYRNRMGIDVNGIETEDEACVGAARVSLDKQVVGVPVTVGDVTTVTYELTVTNDGTGPTRYDLVDRLRFGAGVEVLSARATTDVASVAPNPRWNGLDDVVVAEAVRIDADEVHVYRVVVESRVAATAEATAQDCQVDGGEAGTGFLNEGELVVNGEVSGDDACTLADVLAAGGEGGGGLEGGGEGPGRSAGRIAFTGGDVVRLVGLALLLGGAGLLANRRRRVPQA